ncbi:putative nucleic acid-binding protein [Palleronia aestuarii]|uniref:Putative nucleic acid-binding protein n=1 Tax=Palleronia aestuarii TaxID=568105 RepID=A0A2W7N6F2_9RHOB|nr:PIN domain-containing protein [Palleronia aestuarii]PZX12434.1 putative nucleic acid-binding protein [Palleronia aestuarii]
MRRGDQFTALVDACVLGGALRRNLILSLAEAGLFRLRWSDAILDETERTIARITEGKADTARQRAAMVAAFPEAMVLHDRTIEAHLALPDPGDVHVLAAAINAKVDVIVTDNVKDFPADPLEAWEIEAVTADAFIADCLDLDSAAGVEAIRRMRERLRHPQFDADGLIRKMEGQGLVHAAAALHRYRTFI